MVTALVSTPVRQNALDIPRLTHTEAKQLALNEFERILAVVENLSGEDWEQPTDCTEWTVRDMVAHLAGACAGYARFTDFKRQYLLNPHILRAMSAPVDGVNRRQIEDRAAKSHAEVIAEFSRVGPRAVHTRYRIPWLLRKLRLPLGAPIGIAPLEYLLDTIYPRDQWMHRADICRATGQKMRLTPEHDGRMVSLVLRDLAYQLRKNFQHTVDLFLVGDIRLAYRLGKGDVAETSLTMDLIEFNRLASGRLLPNDALEIATIEGDSAIARKFLENCSVPY